MIRENPETRFILILAMTAGVTMDDKRNCFRSGCDDFIAKPFTVKEMSDCIERLLKQFTGILNTVPA